MNHGGKQYRYHSLKAFAKANPGKMEKLPFSLKILLENLLRQEDGIAVKKKDIEALATWNCKSEPDTEIQFMPARVLLQDFTGVPCVADLAAMRGALKKLGGDPNRINPLQPVDLVIDHSVQVDKFGTATAFQENADIEFERNRERYEFLRWGQNGFKDFRAVPPDTGIVHQVNLEYLSHVAMERQVSGDTWVYPDTMVGTDSHTTMINGLGCLGWGVGGIEAEAAMLGQPCTMLIPQVVGFRLTGKMAPGTTATDLVLTVTQMLRKKGGGGNCSGGGSGYYGGANGAVQYNYTPGGGGSSLAGGGGYNSSGYGGSGASGGSAGSGYGGGGGGYGSGGGAGWSGAGGGSSGASGTNGSNSSGGIGASTWSASATLPAGAGQGGTAAYNGGNAGLVILKYSSPTSSCPL